MRSLIPAALLAVLPLAVATSAAAQDTQEAEVQQCTAELSPATIAVASVQHFTAQLTEDIGEITGLQAPEDSGLLIATPEEVEMTEMAAEEATEEAAEAIDMAAEGFSATVWLSAKSATAGTYEIVLQGEVGACTAEITIEGEESSN